ncbi:uncharacterized protein [Palaemon carinicauda]|uniref:uncharacterized protein n=1 Tax=Palaemon carinicauda TaxID=392227 RepID=UPI0035B69790
MKTLMSLVLYTSSSLLIFVCSKEEYFWSSDFDKCEHQDERFLCDYRGKGESIIHYEDPANSSIKHIEISNSQKVLIMMPLCKDLELHNISKISFMKAKHSDNGCEKGGKLSVYESELAIIPFGLRKLNVQNSIIDLFGPSLPRNYDIRQSHVKILNITDQIGSGSIGFIYNSTIDIMVSLKIGPDFTLFIQDSFINHIHQRAILVKDGILVFRNTLVKSAYNDSVLLKANTSLEVEGFIGNLGLKVLSHKNYSMESQFKNDSVSTRSLESSCVGDDAYFKAFVCFLALFIIMTLLFVVQVISKRMIIMSAISSTITEFPIASEPDKKPDTPISPLLPDTTDRSQCSLDEVDEFEDELLKAYEVTIALYLEDIDDIKLEMQAAIDSRKKEELDEYLKENMKFPELQDLQTKKSQIDKHTALMERTNHALEELIKKQYQNHSFNLQNAGNNIKIKYKEIMVECNNRILDDLTEIIKIFISKLDDELQGDKNHSASMIIYIRDLVAKLLRSTNQLAEKLKRFSSKCEDEYKTSLSELEESYKAKVQAISACAEERSDLLKRTEEEDAEVYGSEKALRLSLIQEEISFASQELRQKEAYLDFSQENQKLLLQEQMLHHQTDNIKHLERIIMTLSDIRRCYILAIGSS